jgi:hypothetical protein
MLVRGAPGLFPPDLVVQVKALACELPAKYDLPLSRWSTNDLVQHVQESGLVASISGSTLWRWLHEDAIRPWYQRSWIFPRDQEFAAKAGRVLDLYARQWQDRSLRSDEFVISADEKTSIQARRRKHPTQTCRPRTPMHVKHEYFRCGAWTYIAALDVHHTRIFGRCESSNGIGPFDRLVEQVMTRPPYDDARQVFFGSSTIAQLTAEPKPLSAYEAGIPGLPSCMLLYTPVGSTRSRSTSPSSRERSSRPTISPTSTQPPNVSSIFSATGRTQGGPSNGSSPARILRRFWLRSPLAPDPIIR